MNRNLKTLLVRHETILFFVVILEWLFFRSIAPRFGTLDNTGDILRHSVEIGLLALVMTPIILTGGIDLSVGSLLGLCAISFAKLWRDAGLPIPVAMICTLCIGAAAGGLNGILITRLRLPPLIVTLGTYSLFRGLAEAITHGVDTFTNFSASFLFLGQGHFAGIPAQAPIFLIVAVGIWLMVHRTTLGRSYRAIGFSPEGALYAGIPTRSRIAMAYILAGVVSAMAGIIYTARLGQARADVGTGYELFAITAVVLGGTSIFGGIGSVHGTLLGVAAIALLNNGLPLARQPREIVGIITGMLLLLALAASAVPKMLTGLRSNRHNSPAKPQTQNSA